MGSKEIGGLENCLDAVSKGGIHNDTDARVLSSVGGTGALSSVLIRPQITALS